MTKMGGLRVVTGARADRPPLLCLMQLPPPIHGVTVVNQTIANSELFASLAGCLTGLIADPSMQRRMGARGRERHTQRYTLAVFEWNLAAALTACTEVASAGLRASRRMPIAGGAS